MLSIIDDSLDIFYVPIQTLNCNKVIIAIDFHLEKLKILFTIQLYKV